VYGIRLRCLPGIINPNVEQDLNSHQLNTRRTTRLKADLMLLSVAIIWGSAFVVQRVAAPHVGIFTFNGLRFMLAAWVLLPIAVRNRLRSPAVSNKKTLLAVVVAGVLLWGGASLQQAGLRYTTAANAGFITGLYVVFIPLILAVGFRRQPSKYIWTAASLSAIGLFLLSTGGRLSLNPGDVLELAGAVFWALHVILIGWLVQRLEVFQMAVGQYLVCGLLGVVFGLAIELDEWNGLVDIWWAVVYTGLFSAAVGYTLQAAGQRIAPPADAAIILSIEAVFAALFGWLLLGELLDPIQLIGCGVIFSGILLAQVYTFRT